MAFDYQTISSAFIVVLAACGSFTLLVNAWKALKEMKKPHDDTVAKVLSHDEKLIHDFNELGEIKEEIRIILQCLMPVMTHLIDGNDVENLKEKRDFLETYLIRLVEK